MVLIHRYHNNKESSFDGDFAYLKVLNFNVLFHIFRQNFDDFLLLGLQSEICELIFHFFTSESDISASTKVSLEVMGVVSYIIKLQKRAFFLIKSVNLKTMLMKDNMIGSVTLKNARVDFFEQNLSYIKQLLQLSS